MTPKKYRRRVDKDMRSCMVFEFVYVPMFNLGKENSSLLKSLNELFSYIAHHLKTIPGFNQLCLSG